jgi:class 3 adenylate cyclase
LTGERVVRRLAAIVSADVAGYSRLIGREEVGTLAALKELRREVVDPRITAHGGRIVKTTGDELLLEFASVVDAVRCMVEVQVAMAERGAEIPEDRRIVFRIGVNLGDIIIDGDDIFGDGVNIAARLQEISAPGGVCVSNRVYEDIRDRLDTGFEDENIARPVQIWRWTPGSPASTVAVTAPTAPLALPDKPSIAVLPFQNMSGDPEQEYFADGMVEDIITGLSRTKSMFVIAKRDGKSARGTELLEIHANQFAAALLVPKRILSKILSQLEMDIDIEDERSLEALAKKFKVSKSMLQYRMRNLSARAA